MSAIILSPIEELEAEQRSNSVLAHLYKQALDSELVVELPHIQEAVEHLIANPITLPEVELTSIPEHWGLEEARRDEAEAKEKFAGNVSALFVALLRAYARGDIEVSVLIRQTPPRMATAIDSGARAISDASSPVSAGA